MEFSSARVDDLVRRVESPREMTEFFEGRKDFLYYRHVVFVQLSEPDLGIDPDDQPLEVKIRNSHFIIIL